MASLLAGLFALVFLGLQGQDYCLIPSDKKLNRLAQEVLDTNAQFNLRLSNAIELEKKSQGSIWALYHKTELQYWRNWSLQKPVVMLQDEFEAVLDSCDYDFPMAYYFLGNIYYLKGNKERAKSFYSKFIQKSKGAEGVPLLRVNEAKENIRVLNFRDEIDARIVEIKTYKVAGVNTVDQEYLPAISPDNQELYFTRKYQEQLLGEFKKRDVEKVMVGTRMGESNDFSAAVNLEPPFNEGSGNYGGMSISLTGKEIFLTICNRDRTGYANCDIYHAEKKVSAVEDGNIYYFWEPFDTLGTELNGLDSWESQPSFSADGQSLLFAKYSDFTNGIDIYIATKDSAGNWMPARPLGGQVNSAGNDKAPFLHPDGNTLYFSSDGHLGLGGYDIFMSKKEDGIWQKPINLGKPINSEEDEHGLIVSTDGKFAYFGSAALSNRGDLDIISFELPKAYRPEEVLVYKGLVNNPTDGAKLELTKADGKKIADLDVSSGDGMYAAILKKSDLDQPVVATLKKEGYAFSSEVIQSDKVKNGLITGEKLELREIKTGEPYRINDINFSSNSAALTSEAKSVLNQFLAFLDLNKRYKVLIQGHTDNIGGAAANKTLSIDRALAVKQYLQQKGVPESRLSFKGFGQEQPLASNDTELGRAKNRRTEFVLSE